MDEIINYVMETPGNTNPNVLRGMLNNSGGNLPAVTAEDNGDVLTVVSGEWAKATPSGGVLVVGMEMDLQGEMLTLDKTWQEIFEAALPIIKIVPPEGQPLLANWVRILDVEAPQAAGDLYYVVNIDDPSGQMMQFVADSANDYPHRSMK